MTDASSLRARMVADLHERGELPARWRAAFSEVERHVFIPPVIWRHQPGAEPNDFIPLHRAADPQRWMELTYANASVDTQVDDGHPAPDGTGYEPTSSASKPAIVANMLDMLDVQPGIRVLEIGTGTGYNAALLAHRLGGRSVTSVEVDPVVADRARTALKLTGYDDVTVITGDGEYGYPPHAPYDRIIATAGVSTIPSTWVAQTTPGGRIVLPLAGTYHPPGILTLTVHDDGTATGRLGRRAAFMALRAQRIARPRPRPIDLSSGAISRTEIHPYEVIENRDAAVAIGLRVPRCYSRYDPHTGILWLFDREPDTKSWAAVTITAAPPYEVRQHGERNLWDEIAAAYQWWTDAGQPPVHAWQVTVSPTSQRIELRASSTAPNPSCENGQACDGR